MSTGEPTWWNDLFNKKNKPKEVKSPLAKILEETIPDRVLKPTVYRRRRFKIFYGEMAMAVFMGKKVIEGAEPYCWGTYLNQDFQTDGDPDSDIMIVEVTKIKGEFQLMCKCDCGIIDKRYPCEHMLDDLSVKSYYESIVLNQRLEFAMKMQSVRV